MILSSLYTYYQILCADPDSGIAEPGYSTAMIGYAINLSTQGELLDIFPLFSPVKIGKITKDLPRRMPVPEVVKRSVNVSANFMWDNGAYVLGVADKETKDADYSQKRFDAFREHNLAILSPIDSVTARAVKTFLSRYDTKTLAGHPAVIRHRDGLAAGNNLVFQVDGRFALEDPDIRHAWERYLSGQEGIEMQCLVSGEIEPVARLHPDIKGVRDAQSKGASLISFNLDAFTSYGRDKGTNAPVSQRVASGCGVALNYLLSPENPNRKIQLGDTTVVYWAESSNPAYAKTFASLINPSFLEEEPQNPSSERKDLEAGLGKIAGKVQSGQAIDIAALQKDLDPETRFYVLGLAPNVARLSVRFFLTEPFGRFVDRIMQHYGDLQIQKEFENQPDYISPYRILAECVSPKVSRRDEEVKASWGLMSGSLMRSILNGTPYPEGLYTAMLNRIRHDIDEKDRSVKLTYTRAAVIKACLLRKYCRQASNPYQEVLQMSLNETYTNPAYVLGRLFAVLEKAQREAIGEVNAGIKDKYFNSACATPASAFPTLLRMSHHYTSKAEYGGSLDRRIQDLMELLDARPFPSRLTLDEQGIFVLGYYHQRANFYVKNAAKSGEAEAVNQ
jgi:CRISPR-associated protein Csd1